jgi:hypothetical protein
MDVTMTHIRFGQIETLVSVTLRYPPLFLTLSFNTSTNSPLLTLQTTKYSKSYPSTLTRILLFDSVHDKCLNSLIIV